MYNLEPLILPSSVKQTKKRHQCIARWRGESRGGLDDINVDGVDVQGDSQRFGRGGGGGFDRVGVACSVGGARLFSGTPLSPGVLDQPLESDVNVVFLLAGDGVTADLSVLDG